MRGRGAQGSAGEPIHDHPRQNEQAHERRDSCLFQTEHDREDVCQGACEQQVNGLPELLAIWRERPNFRE
jgi:hypothetical protein